MSTPGIRSTEPGAIHHVVQNSIAEARIFQDVSARMFYLRRLAHVLEEENAKLFVFAIMDTHVHLLLMCLKSPLDHVMQRIGTGFAVYYNGENERDGHVFARTFWSKPVGDDRYFCNATRYIVLNPKEGGIVRTVNALRHVPDRTNLGALLGTSKSIVGDVDATLSKFGPTTEAARAQLLTFLGRGNEGFDPFAKENDRDDALMREKIAAAREARARRIASMREVRARGVSLQDVMELVEGARGVPKQEILSRSKLAEVSAARALIAHLGVNEIGMTRADVARALGISHAAASTAAIRGARLASKLRLTLLTPPPATKEASGT